MEAVELAVSAEGYVPLSWRKVERDGRGKKTTIHMQTAMAEREAMLSRKLIRLERECRRLREMYEVSLELVDREKELKCASVFHRL